MSALALTGCRGCGALKPFADLIDHDTPFGSVYLCASCFAGECV